uniref:SMP-LTD domain-containing protein n=1 Tax=Davidia involucrata TaxID=16924 RepID=A0A5B7CBA1_DAVIN
MLLLTLFLGFFLGALTIVGVEALGVLYVIGRLTRRVEEEEAKAASQSSRGLRHDLDPKPCLDLSSLYNKKGVVWVLESDKVPKTWLVDKVPKEQKRKKELLDVSPVRKYAKIKDQSLILTDSAGSYTEIQLKGCLIAAVSATSLSSRKWAKRFPIKMESKTSEIYCGSKIFYIYLETSWEKESWCKALRLASSYDKEKLKWFAKLNSEFHSYLTSLNSGYPSLMKPSLGFNVEPINRSIKLDGSSSKVRHFLKKLAKKASQAGVENKMNWTSMSGREERKINDKSRSFQDSDLVTGSVKNATSGKAPNCSREKNIVPSVLSTSTHSGSGSHISVVSDTDSDDKIVTDEGTLCWNLLISRLFFDAKSNAEMRNSMKERIQRTLSNMRSLSYIGEVTCTGIDPGNVPPYIHGMKVLPLDMNEVWALEIDIEYSGGAVLDIETRLEVRELDFQGGIVDTNLESSSVGEVTSDLLEGFEDFGKQLKLSEGTVDAIEQKDEEDSKLDGIKSSKSTTQASSHVSRWKSILNSIAKQVSQVPISLGIRVAYLRGTMQLRIKPPPSDQIWFGFTSMPDIEFHLDSFVGEHKISSGRIALFLISRFKAAIRETLVLPNCESVCIPWMLAEKDDWVPRKAAPFIWINQEVVTDPTTVREVTSPRPGEVTPMTEDSRGTTSNYPEGKHDKVKKVECVQQRVSKSSDAHAPSLGPGNQSTWNSNPLQELRTPLLKNDEPQETCQRSKEENLECQSPLSPSRSLNLMEEQIHIIEEDDARPKIMGTKARMRDLGKKMGEKLEEKRRNIEEKGRHIVERMRGP